MAYEGSVEEVAAWRYPAAISNVVTKIYGKESFPDPVGKKITVPFGAYELDPEFGVVDLGDCVLEIANGVTIFANSQYVTLTTASLDPLITYLGPPDPNFPFIILQSFAMQNTGGGDAVVIDPGVGSDSSIFFSQAAVFAGAVRIKSGSMEADDSTFFTPIIVDGDASQIGMVLFQSVVVPGSVALDILPGSSVFRLVSSQWLAASITGAPDAAARMIRVDDPAQVGTSVHTQAIAVNLPTPLEGLSVPLTEGSDNWYLRVPEGMPESTDQGLSSWTGAGQAVACAVTPAFSDIASIAALGVVYAEDPSKQKFSLADTVNGQLRYDGLFSRGYQVGFTVTIARDSGTSIDLEFGIILTRAAADTLIVSTISDLPGVGAKFQTAVIQNRVVNLEPGDLLRPVASEVAGANMKMIRINFAASRVGA